MKEDEKKITYILVCTTSSWTIRGAGSLSISLERSGPIIQEHCVKIRNVQSHGWLGKHWSRMVQIYLENKLVEISICGKGCVRLR